MSDIERWTMVVTPCGDLRASGFDWCAPLESCCMSDRSNAKVVEVVSADDLEGAVEAARADERERIVQMLREEARATPEKIRGVVLAEVAVRIARQDHPILRGQ